VGQFSIAINLISGSILHYHNHAGDALGSLFEFQSPEDICRNYPNGVRDLADGGTLDLHTWGYG